MSSTLVLYPSEIFYVKARMIKKLKKKMILVFMFKIKQVIITKLIMNLKKLKIIMKVN
jgi:hypothetical protein